MKALILSIACLFCASSVYGQSCATPYRIYNRPAYHTPIHAAPYHRSIAVHEVIKEVPIAVPILVPAFQFQYAPPCFVPAPAISTPPLPPYNPTVASPHITPHQTVPSPVAGQAHDPIRALAQAILQEMQRTPSTQQPSPSRTPDQGPPTAVSPSTPPNGQPAAPPPVGAPANGQPLPPAGNTPPPLPPGVNPEAGRTIMTREQAAPVAIGALHRSCAACHTGAGSKGETIIFVQPGVVNPNASWRSIVREIESGRMPPRQSQFRPTNEEFEAIRTWLSGS